MNLRICFLLLVSSSSFALPVFDFANWIQNGKVIVNQVNQIKNQIQGYQLQLNHYNTLLQNTKSLTSFQWDNANQVINNLLESTNTIDYYKQEAGSLNTYLERFQTTEFYKNSACFTGNCSKDELNKIDKSKLQASVAEKRANDAMVKGIDKQQERIKTDSEKLSVLQEKAETADGQKQALQAASQLASNQAYQLLQIRGLMLAGQNAQATRYASEANKEAIVDAGDSRFREGEYHHSSGTGW